MVVVDVVVAIADVDVDNVVAAVKHLVKDGD